MPKPSKKNDLTQTHLEKIQAFKEEVRERYPIDRAIEDIAGVRFIQRAGSTSKMACCPFHQEKSPSFSVNPQAGYYYCFGSGCGAKGDIFRFIMDHENVSFMEALRIAGRNAGVAFPALDDRMPQAGPRPAEHKRPANPDRDRRTHPGNMPGHELIPIPEQVRVPRAGAWASAWHEGNNKTPARVRRYRPSMVHEYRNSAGQLLMSVLRVEMTDRKRDNGKPMKFFMPFRFAELPEEASNEVVVNPSGRLGWLIRGVPSGCLRPVYGMEMTPGWSSEGGRKVLVVEGEKTADAARRLLSGTLERSEWIVFSPLGGGNSALHADWSEFAAICAESGSEIDVLVWPDADAPTIMRKTGQEIDRQKVYAADITNGIGHALHRAGVDPSAVGFSRIRPVEGVASGWDLADAEKEGWTGEDLLEKIRIDRIPVTPDPDFMRVERSTREGVEPPHPFDHDDLSIEIETCDAFLEEMEGVDAEDSMSTTIPEGRDEGDGLPEVKDILPNPVVHGENATGGIAVRDLSDEEILGADAGGDDLIRDPKVVRILENRHFRCLGYMDGVSYFMSLDSGQVFDLTPAKMKSVYLYHLAPARFWREYFSAPADRNGSIRIDWDDAIDALIQATNLTGQYDPCSHVGQGTWLDGGRIVFNNGRSLWVEGEGVVRIQDFCGQKSYVVGKFCGMPDFENPFPADAPEIWALLDIIRAIHWAPEGRNVSIMNMFGWLAIGPICGVLQWRPHLYLSGERGVGKSWIINNIINKIFDRYGENVKADSTESGLRNLLNGRAFPLIFDEAEGETMEDRQRMAKIIRLARHSATPGNSIVAQGVSGGGGQRQYAIASTFLMCSITPQLTASADFTRFGRAHLLGGLSHYDFVERIKGPADRLLTSSFSSRFMARMIIRAKDMDAVSSKMQEGLSTYNMEQRLIDVYGTYLAGAWLLLRDDVPESGAAAMHWARKTFDMIDDLISQVREISEDKDHVRLFRVLLSANQKVESMSIGNRTYTVGELIETVLGRYAHEDSIPPSEAVRALSKLGIRLGRGAEPVDDKSKADSLLIHRKSTHIEDILEKTPYAKSYVDVMTQAKGVRKDLKMVRFNGPPTRIIVVPLASLHLGEDI